MYTNKLILDPREYTDVYPKSNIVIKQAINLISQFNIEEYPQLIQSDRLIELLNKNNELVATILKLLHQENDALINVALNLSPSHLVTHVIWAALNVAINQKNTSAHIFAIPLILVLGTKTQVKIKDSLDSERLNLFFKQHKIFCSDDLAVTNRYEQNHTSEDYIEKANNTQDGRFFISGKLIDASSIAKIKPSQLYHWSRSRQNASEIMQQLSPKLNVCAVEVLNKISRYETSKYEGVFLRFLVGVTTVNVEFPVNKSNLHNNIDNLYFNADNFHKHSIDLMQLINHELKHDGVTLFSIPFAPVNLSMAFHVGNNYRKEIAIQVALSTAIREIRSQGMTPLAFITTDAMQTSSIKIIIYVASQDDDIDHEYYNLGRDKIIETAIWQLNLLDDFVLILNRITELLNDMQVKVVSKCVS